MLAVPSVWHRGRLALLWKGEKDVHVQTYSPNHTDVLILTDPAKTWSLIGFYGWPKEQRKYESWQLLRHLHTRHSFPWLCLGDFNKILTLDEKQGCIPRPLNLMDEFWITLLQCRLVDLGYHGNMFTWENGWPSDAFVQERLDRACTIIDWMDIFPHWCITHLQVSYSNHVSLLLMTHNLD